jgi:hypothetical protein
MTNDNGCAVTPAGFRAIYTLFSFLVK